MTSPIFIANILVMSILTDSELLEIAQLCKAMGSRTRLKLLTQLVSCCGEASFELPGEYADAHSAGVNIGSLGESMDLAPSTVSHHVRELREAGLIRVERRGKQAICRADLSHLRVLAAKLNELAGSSAGDKPDKSCCVVVKPVREKEVTR